MSAISPLSPKPTNWPGVRKGIENAARCFQQEEYQQAKVNLQEILEFAPMEPGVWQLLGRVMQATGEHEEAINAFRKSANLYGSSETDYSDPVATISLAKLLWQQGDRESACSMLDTLMARETVDPRVVALRQTWDREE